MEEKIRVRDKILGSKAVNQKKIEPPAEKKVDDPFEDIIGQLDAEIDQI